MSKPYIELISCESGDWQILKVKSDKGEEEYLGHSISSYIFMEIMRDHLNCDIEFTRVSDEEMENYDF